MTTASLVDHLSAVGVTLYIRDGQLKANAPRGFLTDEDRAFIAEHKAELLEHLTAKSTNPTPWPPRDERLASWPVEHRQRWGERANALEDAGVPWQKAEWQAFVETMEHIDTLETTRP